MSFIKSEERDSHVKQKWPQKFDC